MEKSAEWYRKEIEKMLDGLSEEDLAEVLEYTESVLAEEENEQ